MAAVYEVQSPTEPRADRPVAAKRPAAILVVHGMGQQIPFQTLDAVAEGLRREDRTRRHGALLPPPVANTVVLGDQRLQRLELTLVTPSGAEREVHVYEAYWAPLTEGRVTLRDVTAFLLRGGIAGVVWGWRPFRRWLFGHYVRFPAPVRTVLSLVVALAVVLALVFLNALIVTIAAARAPLSVPPRWLSDAVFSDLTTVLNALVAAFSAFSTCLLAAKFVRRPALLQKTLGALSVVTFVAAIWATLAAAVASAAVMGYHLASASGASSSLFYALGWARAAGVLNETLDAWLIGIAVPLAGGAVVWWALKLAREVLANIRHDERSRRFTVIICLAFAGVFGMLAWLILRLSGPLVTAMAPRHWRRGLAWPLVALAAAAVRRLLIQYVGDVAAYVQPHVLDRFYELRQSIKDWVWRTAHAVYSAPEYDDIILVGHSLGSVVVYDVLNRLLLDRALGIAGAPEIAARTRLLVTIGSPLDKTAFIFAGQSTGSEAREALAASVQPLITNQLLRPPWINIHSPWDFISGALDYYDLPHKGNTHAVRNETDPAATTLLAAHVEYWTDPLLFETLARHLD